MINPDEVNADDVRREERVLVLVRGRRDAELTLGLLSKSGLGVHVCGSVDELCREIELGGGCALLAEEVLTPPILEAISRVIQPQPAWSDFPIVVFSAGGKESPLGDSARLLGNVTFLERPVQVRSMLASVRAAIGSRRRQYEARRAIETRDTFLAMLGHELRNPLNAIRLAMGVLEQHHPDGQPRELAIVDRQSKHLARLVDDLLDVARVTHGKVTLHRTRENLVSLTRAAFDTLAQSAENHGLEYEFHAEHPEIWIDGDRQRLEQVFTNLLTNAIKYTPRGGAVRMVVVRSQRTALVRVSDTGIGLAPDMCSKIFDVFAQVDASPDRARGGIGLGLALVRNIVQLHSGTVEARSDGLGRGSAFVVKLARADAPSLVPSAESALPLSARPRRVVLVEDSADIRELMAVMLERSGHEVTCAEDGPSGLDAILETSPEIAFVDLGLPGFDGLELARQARGRGFSAPLVALTGYGQAEDKQRAREAGFTEHLTKPVGGSEIERIIQALATKPKDEVA